MVKRHIALIIFMLLCAATLPPKAQAQPPFIFTAHGGLFFPSKSDFKEQFQSASDLIWSIGACLPAMGKELQITFDYSNFRSEGIIDPALDSSAHYTERIIHAGILHKRTLTRDMDLRMMAGFNRVSAQEKISSTRTPEHSLESGYKFGFYGGLGVEQLFDDPHISIYADVVYDYSRSHDKEFYGDLGGVRIVMGVNIIMF